MSLDPVSVFATLAASGLLGFLIYLVRSTRSIRAEGKVEIKALVARRVRGVRTVRRLRPAAARRSAPPHEEHLPRGGNGASRRACRRRARSSAYTRRTAAGPVACALRCSTAGRRCGPMFHVQRRKLDTPAENLTRRCKRFGRMWARSAPMRLVSHRGTKRPRWRCGSWPSTAARPSGRAVRTWTRKNHVEQIQSQYVCR